MSGYLFKSYCYESIEQVTASVHSLFFLDGFGVIQSITSTGSLLSINYLTAQSSLNTVNYSVQSCSKLGFDNTFTGLTSADSLYLSESVVGVLIAAWAFKVVRRAL